MSVDIAHLAFAERAVHRGPERNIRPGMKYSGPMMRRLVRGTVAAISGLAASALAIIACVGADPEPTNPTTVVPDAGDTPDTGGTGTPDSGTPDTGPPDPGTDGGIDSAVKVTCDPPDPQLFLPGAGPFCLGAPANHCAFGEHCCRDTVLNTSQCAASCPSNVVDVACFNAAECNPGGDVDAGLVCCAKGTVATNICSYAVTQDLRSTGCFAACLAAEFQACATQAECKGKTCTPTKALKPDGKSTSPLQIAACR